MNPYRVVDMNNRCLVTALLIVLPTIAAAQDAPIFECTNGELQRRVQVIYETGVSVPCEVHYFKDTESPGNSQVLWRALNEEGYCEAKATEFAEKLESWGWNCTAGNATDISTAPEQIDDTEALTPSEGSESSDTGDGS